MTRAREGAAPGVAAVLLLLVVFAGGGFPQHVRGLVAIPVIAIGCGWLALALAGRSALPRLSRPGRTATLAVLAVLALTALSIAWSASGERSWTETNRSLVYVSLGTVAALLAACRPDARLLSGIVALGVGAALARALAERVIPALGPDLSLPGQSRRLSGAIGYPNGLALMAAMAVPLALWLVVERRAWQRGAGGVLLVMALVAAPLTYSRSGLALALGAGIVWIWRADDRVAPLAALAGAALLAIPAIALDLAGHDGAPFAVALAVALVVAARIAPRLAALTVAREDRLVRVAGLAALGAAALGLLVLVVHAGGPADFVRARWHDFASAKPGSEGADRLASVGSYRWSWWKEAWHGFESRPVGGHGAGSFALTHLHARANALSVTQAPHSMPLQVLTELGLVGFVLVALGVHGILRASRNAVVRAEETRVALTALALVPVLAAVHALVDLDWELIAVDGVAVFAGGALLVLAGPGLAARKPRLLAAAAVVVVGLAALYSVAAPLLAQRQLDGGLSDPLVAYDRAGVARAYDPLSVAALLRQAQAAHLRAEDGLALSLYRKATRLEPENPLPWTALGDFQWHVVGDICSAYQAYNHAYTDDPATAVAGGALDRTRRAVNHHACS